MDWLVEIIDTTTESSYESRKRINEIAHLVIAEFVAEGFVLEELKKYSTDIPGVAIAVGGVVMAAPTEFLGLKAADYASEEEYYEALSERIKNRTTQECLDVLKEHYYATPRDSWLLIPSCPVVLY